MGYVSFLPLVSCSFNGSCELDVEIHHLETAKQLEFTNVSVVARGPLRGSVKAEVKYGKSIITVTVGQFLKIRACLMGFLLDIA